MAEVTMSYCTAEPTNAEKVQAVNSCGFQCVPMWVRNQKCSEKFVDRYVGNCPRCDRFLSFDPGLFEGSKSHCKFCGQAIWWDLDGKKAGNGVENV